MSNGPYVPFEYREGGRPAPTQLGRQSVSNELRSLVWWAVYEHCSKISIAYGNRQLDKGWKDILRRKHIVRDHSAVDEFDAKEDDQILTNLKKEIYQAPAVNLYALVEWLMRASSDLDFRQAISDVLVEARAPYRVLSVENVLAPIASETDLSALERSFQDVGASGLAGARAHLLAATANAGSGAWADSVRESIHAVESVAVKLAPGEDTLGAALKALDRRSKINGTMRSAFEKLYAYANSESGIRHALLEQGDANVTEADALFMLGACASFVSYLVNIGRATDLLK